VSTNTTDGTTGTAPATVVIGEHVRPGCEQAHDAWQHKLNEAAATFPGFIGAEVSPPSHAEADWTVVYRFDSVKHLQSWLNSGVRQELLNQGADLHDRSATQQVMVGVASPEELVTVVVSHKVSDELVDEFLSWQEEMTEAERGFEGFRGSELFRPVPGVQDEWTAVYRFDSGTHLEQWLDSDERKHLLEQAKHFQDFRLRTIQNSFGNWFDFGDRTEGEKGPSGFKTSIAVWVGLYPTVMFLTLAISELFPDAKLWQMLLVGNLASSFIMTYVTMPWGVNRILRPWLTSGDDAPQPETNLKGLALSGAIVLVCAVIFWATTTQIWHLP